MNRREGYRKSVFGLVACLTCTLVLWNGGGSGREDAYRLPGVAHAASGEGMAAPDFELKDLNGASVRLSAYKGTKSVLLYFWATWCPYCIQAKPQIAKLRDSISPGEMEILGVNVGGGDSLEKLRKYQQGHPVSWPVLYDENGSAVKAYQIQGIPLFVLINKQGNIAYRGNVLPPDVSKMLK